MFTLSYSMPLRSAETLALCCPRHSDTFIYFSEPHDFERKSPEGWCNLPRARRLNQCGHQYRRCVIQQLCTTALYVGNFACVFGQPMGMDVLTFVARVWALHDEEIQCGASVWSH